MNLKQLLNTKNNTKNHLFDFNIDLVTNDNFSNEFLRDILEKSTIQAFRV